MPTSTKSRTRSVKEKSTQRRDRDGRFVSINARTNTVEAFVQNRITSLVSRIASWSGTMTELNEAILTGVRRSVPENYPGSPSVLRRVVNKVLTSLQKNGVRVSFSRGKERIVELTKTR